jgi:hypothetical protein
VRRAYSRSWPQRYVGLCSSIRASVYEFVDGSYMRIEVALVLDNRADERQAGALIDLKRRFGDRLEKAGG